jgi:ribosome-binding protein aMBF1 (putative translation factor)
MNKTKTCPVCDWEIKDDGIKVKVAGQEITVCCDDCAKKAQENPSNYAATS